MILKILPAILSKPCFILFSHNSASFMFLLNHHGQTPDRSIFRKSRLNACDEKSNKYANQIDKTLFENKWRAMCLDDRTKYVECL